MNQSSHEILIVDDDQNNRFLLTSLLEKDGYKTATAKNGEDALEVLETYKPDLILLDIKMPLMDGHETAVEIKNDPEFFDTPILFISSMNDSKNIMQAFEDGAVDFISKPFRKPEVLARVKTHLELKDLRTKAEEHAKEMEHFAYMAAHDLKSPARVISNLVRQMEEGSELDSEELTYRIGRSSKKLGSLIDSLLQLSDGRKKNFLRKGVDVVEVLAEVEEEFAETLKTKNGTISSDIDGMVYSEPTALKILLKNLISNSIKYARTDEPLKIKVSLVEDGENFKLTIKDNGLGFKVEEGKDPFQAFSRFHGLHIEGHGLGLAICKRIMDCHKGKISIDSDLKAGTSVSMEFPNHF